ncbi:MAG: hypothetical protein GX785_16215 [Armatimonadetes bacterium]|jgi:hypothetical protein|nr:hypothetical protein [Armatimonadota bacterium]HOM82924.1 hypothetical protein [Armatimonadota bacterium]HOQ30693.1 hypothetical protein [Armatimonadota bacterium]HPO73920.1 hypothetical protein [Armatimonadota bacterium]
MEWQSLVGWLVAAATALWALVRRNRAAIALHAAEAVAFAEKYYWGAPDEALEREALRYFEEFWPSVPAPLVRAAVREICRRRKTRAHGLVPDQKPA